MKDSVVRQPGTSKQLIEKRISEPKQLLTVKELAHHYRISPKTIYKWVASGIIEPEPAGPKLIRFDLEKVEQRLLMHRSTCNGN